MYFYYPEYCKTTPALRNQGFNNKKSEVGIVLAHYTVLEQEYEKIGVDSMKKILIITNEWSKDDFGFIKGGTIPEIKNDFYLINNLIDVVSSFPDVEVTSVYHNDLTIKMVEDLRPDCIITSGRMADWDMEVVEDEYAAELDLIRNYRVPLLGICGGMQLIAMAYGVPIGRMTDKEGNEVREFGVMNVTVLSDDPLFRGLENPMRYAMAHVDEIKDVPLGYSRIASTDKCRIGAIKSNEHPIWGLQFHPEMYKDSFKDGMKLLENFIYGDFNQKEEKECRKRVDIK